MKVRKSRFNLKIYSCWPSAESSNSTSESQINIMAFANHIIAADVDKELQGLALVIDGFTRFSARVKFIW